MEKKVLLIEDDLEQVLAYKVALEQAKIPTRAATSATIAWAMAKADPPRVILLDTVLSEADGELLLKQIKTDPATKNIPIIVFATFDKKSVRCRFQELGVTEFWTKTRIAPSDLVQRMRAYLAV